LMEHALTQNVERDVAVPLFQNFVGGVGVATVIMAVGLLWMRDLSVELLIWAGCCGLGAFGLASLVRAFRDEVSYVAYHWARGWAEGHMSQELDFLAEENERLQMLNRELNTANAQMSKYVRVDAPVEKPQPIEDAYTEPLRDALALCRFHEAHGTITREKVMASGMKRAQWDSARRLLVDAGVTLNGSAIAIPSVTAMGMVRDFVSRQRQAVPGFVMPGQGQTGE
jgi:hypothetical protein